MTDPENQDRSLLARLNALKHSPVTLDPTRHSPPTSHSEAPSSSLAGLDLHNDLTARFESLQGRIQAADPIHPEVSNQVRDTSTLDQDGQTIEELPASLETETNPAGDADQIHSLLASAKSALQDAKSSESNVDGPEDPADMVDSSNLPNIDVSIFQPEPIEADCSPKEEPKSLPLDDEADQVLKRIMDEVKYEIMHGGHDEDDENGKNDDDDERRDDDENHDATSVNTPSKTLDLDLPSTPSTDPLLPPQPTQQSNNTDSDLASRFASLSLPSTSSSTLQSLSMPKSKTTPSNHPSTPYTDSEISTWCTICLSPATLRCVGCSIDADTPDEDGNDLYCTNCWLEGHRGPDAGYEEKRHKAVMFSKGGRKKERKRRVAVGA